MNYLLDYERYVVGAVWFPCAYVLPLACVRVEVLFAGARAPDAPAGGVRAPEAYARASLVPVQVELLAHRVSILMAERVWRTLT